jgi:hypothetical protein
MAQGGSPSQSWKTFLRNHERAIAGIDLCVVPMLTFERLFAFLDSGPRAAAAAVVRGDAPPDGRVAGPTDHRGLPWASAPAYLVRDNDRAYGHVFTTRVRAMGIRDRPIAPGSPWQNGHESSFSAHTGVVLTAQVRKFRSSWLCPGSRKCMMLRLRRARLRRLTSPTGSRLPQSSRPRSAISVIFSSMRTTGGAFSDALRLRSCSPFWATR